MATGWALDDPRDSARGLEMTPPSGDECRLSQWVARIGNGSITDAQYLQDPLIQVATKISGPGAVPSRYGSAKTSIDEFDCRVQGFTQRYSNAESSAIRLGCRSHGEGFSDG